MKPIKFKVGECYKIRCYSATYRIKVIELKSNGDVRAAYQCYQHIEPRGWSGTFCSGLFFRAHIRQVIPIKDLLGTKPAKKSPKLKTKRT